MTVINRLKSLERVSEESGGEEEPIFLLENDYLKEVGYLGNGSGIYAIEGVLKETNSKLIGDRLLLDFTWDCSRSPSGALTAGTIYGLTLKNTAITDLMRKGKAIYRTNLAFKDINRDNYFPASAKTIWYPLASKPAVPMGVLILLYPPYDVTGQISLSADLAFM